VEEQTVIDKNKEVHVKQMKIFNFQISAGVTLVGDTAVLLLWVSKETCKVHVHVPAPVFSLKSSTSSLTDCETHCKQKRIDSACKGYLSFFNIEISRLN
jgi:hypothetical protein